MSNTPLSAAERRKIQALRDAGWSLRDVAAEVGRAASTIGRVSHGPDLGLGGRGRVVQEPPSVLDEAPEPEPEPDEPAEAATVGFAEKANGTAEAVVTTGSRVRTLAEAVRAAGVDTTVWRVEKWECVNTSGPRGETFKLKLTLKRLLPKHVGDAVEAVFKKFRDAAPRWPKVDRERASKAEPFLAVFGLADIHFGKLAWAPETGEHYDLRIADTLFRNAVEDLIAENRHRPIARILLPLGNDLLHVDSKALMTTAGTPQDFDGRFSKMLATASAAVVWAVEQMAAVAPVQVELVPGNHDRTMSECLCHIIAARFHHTDRVTVNADPKTRKYVRFGTNLIGLTHGDLVKPAELPNVMATDAPRDWADTTTREWLIGHGHRSMKWTTKDTDTHRGVVVRMLRALTRTDLWHFDHGYLGQQPAAEVYFYGAARGYAGHSVVPAREG